MRAKWLWVAALAAAAAGCGEGRAIFNIDVYSFLKNANAETLPYVLPPPAGLDTIPVQTLNSIGIGGASIVDTVRLIGSVEFDNTSGTGNVTFAVYFDTVKTTVYTGTPAFNVVGAVTPGSMASSPFDIKDLPTALKPLFLSSTVYVGIQASSTDAVSGTAKLTALQARIVIKDKIF